MLSAAGGCELSTTTAWKKFKELLLVLSSHHLSFKTLGRVYSSCVWSAMLHASETWPLTKPYLQRQGNDQTDLQCHAIRHCHHQVQWANCEAWHWESWHSEEEKAPLVCWPCEMLQWCSQSLWHIDWWEAWACEAQDDMEAADREEMLRVELSAIDPHDRHTWRSYVKSAMGAASQLPGPLVWMLPLYLHVNKKSDDDDDDDDGNSRLSTLMLNTLKDLLQDLQQARYQEGVPLMWMLPLYLHGNQKSDDDDGGSSRLSTLMINIPGDLLWDLPCVQQASYLMWMSPLYLHVNQKSDDVDDDDDDDGSYWCIFTIRDLPHIVSQYFSWPKTLPPLS